MGTKVVLTRRSLYEGPETIADHILALYSAKLLAYTKHDPEKLVIDLEKITAEGQTGKEGAIFIHTSKAGESVTEGPGATVEKRLVQPSIRDTYCFLFDADDSRIDELFLDHSTVEKAFRLETYRSTGAISSTVSQQLRCYFVARCVFPPSGPVKNAEGLTDIRSVSDAAFLEKASDHTIDIYQEVLNEVERRSGPVIEMFEVEESRERRIVIGFK